MRLDDRNGEAKPRRFCVRGKKAPRLPHHVQKRPLMVVRGLPLRGPHARKLRTRDPAREAGAPIPPCNPTPASFLRVSVSKCSKKNNPIFSPALPVQASEILKYRDWSGSNSRKSRKILFEHLLWQFESVWMTESDSPVLSHGSRIPLHLGAA